jgi:hypothetical protein
MMTAHNITLMMTSQVLILVFNMGVQSCNKLRKSRSNNITRMMTSHNIRRETVQLIVLDAGLTVNSATALMTSHNIAKGDGATDHVRRCVGADGVGDG